MVSHQRADVAKPFTRRLTDPRNKWGAVAAEENGELCVDNWETHASIRIQLPVVAKYYYQCIPIQNLLRFGVIGMTPLRSIMRQLKTSAISGLPRSKLVFGKVVGRHVAVLDFIQGEREVAVLRTPGGLFLFKRELLRARQVAGDKVSIAHIIATRCDCLDRETPVRRNKHKAGGLGEVSGKGHELYKDI